MKNPERSLLSDVKLRYIEKYLHGSSLLDVGAGQCLYTKWIVEKNPHVRAIAIDLLDVTPGDDITYLKSDLEKPLSFDNEQFDAIVAFDIIEHVSHSEELLSELFRVCKRGGVLIGSVPHDDDKFLPAYNLTFYHRSDLTHKRYYLSNTLSDVLMKMGFVVEVVKKEGGVSPQVIAEFFPKMLRYAIKKCIGAFRRIGLVNGKILSSDLFFVAHKKK